MLILGIDPGVAPAMALYGGPDFTPVIFPPMGVSRASTKGSKKVIRIDPDEAAIINVFNAHWPDMVAVELVGTMPGQGISSAGHFLHAAGLVTGIALGRGCRVTKVRPQEWQRAFKMPVGDDLSRQHCCRLFPEMAPKFALKKTHNEADALLIAVYIWCMEMGAPVPRC
jgi:crossover junction endodeoxyribonuclease RuvC